MGSPLVPVIANIFLGFYEYKWLNEYNLYKPEFYSRYLDDILADFDNGQVLYVFTSCIHFKCQ